jgi:GntR family transcriptional regulator, arabinose operon transcriptional repressor
MVPAQKSGNSDEEQADGILPKYRHIFEQLRNGIQSGEYRHGTRLPSEAQLVRRFGASRMTIVKAVRELQQLGLVKRKVGSGTYVTTASSGESYQFGLLIAELGLTEIFDPICRGMANSPLARTHSLLWGNSISESQKKEQAALLTCQQYVDQRVSGVFFAPLELTPRMDEVNRKIVSELDRAKIPVVLLDRCYARYPSRSKHDLVGIDNRAAAYIATEHLIRMGARRISFFGQPLSASTVDARIAGYLEALRAHSLLSNENLVARGDPSAESLVANIVRKLKPDAFLCGNDLTAAHVMQSLLNLGKKVPEDIRIVGFDDIKYASLLPVPLTTQHQPCQDIGTIAMRTMIDRMQSPELPTREITLNCNLVIRRSCGSPKRP